MDKSQLLIFHHRNEMSYRKNIFTIIIFMIKSNSMDYTDHANDYECSIRSEYLLIHDYI